MYSSLPPLPTTVGKPDPTAAARSPIRRTASHARSHSGRSQRRQSANAESLFLASQSSPPPAPGDGAIASPEASGNQSAAATLVAIAAREQTGDMEPPVFTMPRDALPFVLHTNSSAYSSSGIPPSHEAPRNAPVSPLDATRRMQVTRQRPAQPASPEADMGRFVVRPIFSDDETGADAPQPSTVDPMELLVTPASMANNTIYQRYRRFFEAVGVRRPAQQERSTRPDERARSRSPGRRAATAPRIPALDPMDGLGDRRRSPSAEVEESDWETLRATIQPDAQLPSASSSFTSASAASSSSFDAQTASAPSSAATTSAPSSSAFRINRRYVLPTAECLDITMAQRECGVACDNAKDAVPPFPPSRGPSRAPTREPSADRPRTRRRRSLLPPAAAENTVDETAVAYPPADFRPPLRIHDSYLGGPMPELSAHARALASEPWEDEVGSTAPAHLRSPESEDEAEEEPDEEPEEEPDEEPEEEPDEEPEPEVEPETETESFDFNAFLTSGPASSDAPTLPSPSELLSATLPAPPLVVEGPSENDAPPDPRLGQRIAEVQWQWHQLRRINELLRCGQEVPGWLWEVAGLAPELRVREFEI